MHIVGTGQESIEYVRMHQFLTNTCSVYTKAHVVLVQFKLVITVGATRNQATS